MSCIFIIAPAIAGGMPMLAAAVAGAAAALGYSVQKNAGQASAVASKMDASAKVELTVPNSEVIEESLQVCNSVTIQRDDISAVFYRDPSGRLKVHVEGENRTEAELKETGQQLVQRVVQQYAYNKVMTEMEHRGFEVVQQEVDESQTIRLRVRKWS